MATEAQLVRQRAQRRLARQVRSGYQRQFPFGQRARQSHEAYLANLLEHPEQITEADKKVLAARASEAYWQDKKPGSHPRARREYKQWDEFFYHGSATDNREYGEG